MSFFRRDQAAPPPGSGARPTGVSAASAERGRAATTLAAGSRFEGKLGGAADVVVEGELRGEAVLEAIWSSLRAAGWPATSTARTVSILGVVEGNVRGRERVELAATGSLTGDVSAPKVVISEGAFFKGKVEMQGAESAPGPGQRSA